MPKKTIPAEIIDVAHGEVQLASDAAAVNALAVMNSEAAQNATVLAREIGYEGSLTVGALEDEIRFYQRRTAEACIELGKRMLLLKELTPHGEFIDRIKLLGFSKSTAYRFMQSAKKFSKLPKLGNLAIKPDSAGKFLELLVLDDEELSVLNEGGSVLGIELDDIDCMSASELRQSLREAREDAEAQSKLLASKNNKIDELTASSSKRQRVSLTDWPAEFQGFINQVMAAKKAIEVNAGALDIIRTDAMSIEAASGEEAALEKARESLGLELSAAITRAEECIAAVRHVFDKTLGALIEE